MSYLAALYAGVEEKPRQVSLNKLRTYSIESCFGEVDRALGLIQALDTNYQHFIAGKSTISTESLQAYEVATQSLLLSAGLAVPSAMIVPSFESTAVATVEAAKEKKDNVLKRAVKSLLDLLARLKEWVMAFFTKKKAALADKAKVVETKYLDFKKEVAQASPALLADLRKAKYYLKVPKAWADKFTNPDKMYNALMENQALLMSLSGKDKFTPEDVVALVKLKADVDELSDGEYVEEGFSYEQFNTLMAQTPSKTVDALVSASKRIQSIIDKTANALKKMGNGSEVKAEELAEIKLNYEAAKAAQQVLDKLMTAVNKFVVLQEKATDEMVDELLKKNK